jgi:hypothetical protein
MISNYGVYTIRLHKAIFVSILNHILAMKYPKITVGVYTYGLSLFFGTMEFNKKVNAVLEA